MAADRQPEPVLGVLARSGRRSAHGRPGVRPDGVRLVGLRPARASAPRAVRGDQGRHEPDAAGHGPGVGRIRGHGQRGGPRLHRDRLDQGLPGLRQQPGEPGIAGPGRPARPARRGGRRGHVPGLGPGPLHHRPGALRRRRPCPGLIPHPSPFIYPEGHLVPAAPVPIPRRFEGRSVVVTGAGTGFGAEIAVRSAQEGARVVGVHYRSSVEGAKRTADRVAAAGSTPVLLQADIIDWAQIKAMADAAFERLDGVDVLVNNVGDVAREQMSWRDITEESIDHILAVDIKGTMLCVHEFGSRMLDQGHGAIVNIGSTVIVRGSARAPQYAAAKYGILGVTKSYAHAFAPTVRVNVFAPGFIETEATLGRKDWQSGRGDQLRSLTPMGRIPGPAELAGTALFLATDDAAHMTGGYMVADGGYNMVGA